MKDIVRPVKLSRVEEMGRFVNEKSETSRTTYVGSYG